MAAVDDLTHGAWHRAHRQHLATHRFDRQHQAQRSDEIARPCSISYDDGLGVHRLGGRLYANDALPLADEGQGRRTAAELGTGSTRRFGQSDGESPIMNMSFVHIT